jgi:hypothetical protein
MHECEGGEHKPPDDSDACYCVTPVLERLGRLKQGLCHPVEDHKRWYQLGPDDQFIDKIRPWVTHQCSPQCFKEDGSLKPDLDGLSGTNGQPPHTNGAVSLPPQDPRPELKRAVMREAMTLIAADVERDELAAKEALAKKKAAIGEMMPGIKLLGDAPDSGAMSRTTSKKKKAVLRVLEQPAEGNPGFSRRGGGGGAVRHGVQRAATFFLAPSNRNLSDTSLDIAVGATRYDSEGARTRASTTARWTLRVLAQCVRCEGARAHVLRGCECRIETNNQ